MQEFGQEVTHLIFDYDLYYYDYDNGRPGSYVCNLLKYFPNLEHLSIPETTKDLYISDAAMEIIGKLKTFDGPQAYVKYRTSLERFKGSPAELVNYCTTRGCTSIHGLDIQGHSSEAYLLPLKDKRLADLRLRDMSCMLGHNSNELLTSFLETQTLLESFTVTFGPFAHQYPDLLRVVQGMSQLKSLSICTSVELDISFVMNMDQLKVLECWMLSCHKDYHVAHHLTGTHSQLRKFKLTGPHICGECIMKIISAFPRVETLTLSCRSIDASNIQITFESLHLKSLHLTDMKNLASTALNDQPKLENLGLIRSPVRIPLLPSIRGLEASYIGIPFLPNTCPRLKRLKLHYCKLPVDTTMVNICNGLTQLTHISICPAFDVRDWNWVGQRVQTIDGIADRAYMGATRELFQRVPSLWSLRFVSPRSYYISRVLNKDMVLKRKLDE